MRLRITHRTEYGSEPVAPYALQRLRLVPVGGGTQKVRSWTLTIEGAREQARFTDHYGNETRLISVEGEPHTVSIEAAGEVETVNKAGVTGAHRGFVPLWLFARETPLTRADATLEALATGLGPGADIGRLHELMGALHERLAASRGASPPQTGVIQLQDGVSQSQSATEEQAPAIDDDAGVRQAHRFIAGARLLGFPARFVSGYRMVDGMAEQTANHAWAEAHVPALGWVGFDVVNCISPEDNYVRVAVGRDYGDAMPISGIRLGQPAERLAVRITVEQ